MDASHEPAVVHLYAEEINRKAYRLGNFLHRFSISFQTFKITVGKELQNITGICLELAHSDRLNLMLLAWVVNDVLQGGL
jgi:hypothetical protein